MGLRAIILVPNGIHGKGGIERLMLYFTRALPDVAADVDVAVHPTRLVERFPLNHLSTPISLIWFMLRLAFGRYQIVHVNIAPRGSTWRKMLFTNIARLFGLQVVLHLHGSGYDAFFESQSPKQKARIVSLFKSADRVVVLGAYWHAFALNTLGLAPERAELVRNGAPDTSSRATPARSPAKIAFAGLVGERKGVDVLLDALAMLPDNLNWTAEIGGNGEVEHYQNLARDMGLSDKVNFRGWLDEAGMDALLTGAQIFVLPSRAENQPMSIIEAMARGLPVVSTTIGAIPEQVTDGVTGHLVAPGDPTLLSAALAKLINDPDARTRLGLAARDQYETHYSIRANAVRFTDIYRQLAADH